MKKKELQSSVRIHVGGLGETVTAEELRWMFELAGGGSVHDLQFVRAKGCSFAYVDFSPSSDNSLNKLFAKYNGCAWEGGKLRLEEAKEHLSRLRREDAAAVAANADLAAPDSSEVPQSLPVAEKSNLRIFFSRLRKVLFVSFSPKEKKILNLKKLKVEI